MSEPENLPDVVMEARRSRDAAYTERNRLVAVLSKVYPSHLAGHYPDPDPHWDPEWRTVVCVHVPGPSGEVSTWHVHDSERHLFAHLEASAVGVVYCPGRKGESTQAKYERLAALPPFREGRAATPLSQNRNCEDWKVRADVWNRGEDGTWLRLDGVHGYPVATLRRIGWLDQKGRVWTRLPAIFSGFDGGSFTPLLIDARENGI